MTELLTIEQAAERTQFCTKTIRQAIKSGELAHGRFGRMIRIRVSDLDAWINAKIVGTMQSPSCEGDGFWPWSDVEKTWVGIK